MIDQIAGVILEKGGLFAALFLGTLYVLLRREQRWDARDADKQRAIDALTEKTRNDMLVVTRQLVEVLTVNNATLGEVRDALDAAPDPNRKAGHDGQRQPPGGRGERGGR